MRPDHYYSNMPPLIEHDLAHLSDLSDLSGLSHIFDISDLSDLSDVYHRIRCSLDMHNRINRAVKLVDDKPPPTKYYIPGSSWLNNYAC